MVLQDSQWSLAMRDNLGCSQVRLVVCGMFSFCGSGGRCADLPGDENVWWHHPRARGQMWGGKRGPLNFDTGVAAAALAPAMTQAQKEWRNANARLLLGWDGTRIDYRTELFFRIDIFDWFGNTLENWKAESAEFL